MAAALAAVDTALVLQPRNIRALLFKADHLERMAESRKALSFYQGALRVAETMAQVPTDVEKGLQRASDICDRQAAQYEDYLLQKLQEKGYKESDSERFSEALAIAFGKKPVYYQQPTRFYYPGLAQRAFFKREEFPWLKAIEAETDVIRAELLQLMQDENCFSPYLEAGHGADQPQFNDMSNVGSMDWSAFFLWKDGELIAENAARCPRTVAALSLAPQPMVAGRTPSALFSKLAPGADIAPHHGVINTRLICHLPLIVPQDCGSLRVGNYAREWREGEALIFDDSIEHEAWNDSPLPRVVLLFDLWRPELDEEERRWVTETLLAADAYGDT